MIDHSNQHSQSYFIFDFIEVLLKEDKQVTVIKYNNKLEVCQVQSDLRMFSRFGTEFPRNSNILIP